MRSTAKRCRSLSANSSLCSSAVSRLLARRVSSVLKPILVLAMEAHDRDQALAIHMDILTRASGTEDIGLWMSGIKQLIVRL